MIYQLRKKFIKICGISLAVVFVLVFLCIWAVTSVETQRVLNYFADIIAQNDGHFPYIPTEEYDDGLNLTMDRETPYTTRFFYVSLDSEGRLIEADTDRISTVNDAQAVDIAKRIIKNGDERGWYNGFRYKITYSEDGTEFVFVSGTHEQMRNIKFYVILILVFTLSSALLMALVIIFSKRAVKPIAAAYDKQKQFITDVNHELRTPLTLIGTNLDIVERELGPNEWLRDMREETTVMTGLVNQLVNLARLDEAQPFKAERFNLGEAVAETVLVFKPPMEKRGISLEADVDCTVFYSGVQVDIRRMTGLLIDNAVKYCDEGGSIKIQLKGAKRPVLTVENTYAEVDTLDMDRLFDRFYRADKARTYGSGYGIGLSVAQAIANKHKASITAFKSADNTITFKVSM